MKWSSLRALLAAFGALALSLFLFPAVALAQAVAPTADALVVNAPGSPLSQLLTELIKAAIILVPLVATYVGVSVRKHFEAKAARERAAGESDKVSTAIARSTFVVEAAIAEVNATLRDKLPTVLADGKITPDEAAELRAAALSRVLAVLGTRGLAELQEAMGIERAGVDALLGGLIEKGVAAAKASGYPLAPILNVVAAPIAAATAAKDAAIADAKKAGEAAAGKIVTVEDAIQESLK